MNSPQKITTKTKDRATRTSLKTGGELRGSEKKVSSILCPIYEIYNKKYFIVIPEYKKKFPTSPAVYTW